MNLIQKSKSLFKDHQHRIQPGLLLFGKCVENFSQLSQLYQKPNVVNYLNIGFKCKANFDEIFKVDPHSYFLTKEWESFVSYEVQPVIAQLVKRYFKDKLKSIHSGQDKAIFVATLDSNTKIGWIGIENLIDYMYVSNGQGEKIKKILAEKIWAEIPSQCLSIDVIKFSWRCNFVLGEENTHQNYISSTRSEYYSRYIKKYLDKSLGRSILFYGPPGTGKSNLMRAISNSLGMKTVRLHKLHDIRNQAIAEIIEVFDPDAVILEDIDHLYSYDLSPLLERIEHLNYRNKYILATANEINKINAALLRPGRFDELIEIYNSDQELIQTLVNNDEDVFNLVKDYPIAFINEVMKRVNVLGKEEALANITDISRRIEKFNLNAEYKL